MRQKYPLAQVVRYLKDVMDGKADRGNIGAAKRKINQLLLNESIVSQADDVKSAKAAEGVATGEYTIKAWKEIDLSKLDVAKLKEEYAQAEYKHIEISDLRAFIKTKLEQLLNRNVTRQSFAQRLEEIINRYNAGGTDTEDYFAQLIDFVEGIKAEEQRHVREGLTKEELELFDLLKKDKLTKEEIQTVKLAARNLLKRLKEEKLIGLVKDWHKDKQSTQVVRECKLAIEVHQRNHLYIEENARLKARNKELEDPEDQHHTNGLGWLGKVVQVIRRIDRPLRSSEILHKLIAMDKDRELSSRANSSTYVSVVLTKGVQAGRLKIYKVPGTRGGYYALEECIDKDGSLIEEMKKRLL